MADNRNQKLLRAYELRRQSFTVRPEAAMMDDSGAVSPPAGDGDLPYLTEEALDYLMREAAALPAEVDAAGLVSDSSVGRSEYLAALERVRLEFNADSEKLTESLMAPMDFERDAATLPPENFRFPAWSADLTPGSFSYQVENHLFETWGDLKGWIVNCGQTKLPNVALANRARATQNFVWHDKVPSRYEYPLVNPDPSKPLQVALFGDFGTGLVHSRYIARQLAALQMPYAFHLGDIYYAGRKHEFLEYFREPLRPMHEHGKTQFFNLSGNHEQFSGSDWYWDDIRFRRSTYNHQQEGSYFRLSNDQFQIIGLDTNSLALEQYDNAILQKWLVDALREGRDKGRTNILLTSENPYEYVDGPRLTHGPKTMFKDLQKAAGRIFEDQLIDLWFWCHVHYATFNEPAPELGYTFIGSCIGHGGYPHGRKSRPSKAKFIRWVETAPRFPSWTKVRQDMGNNGFCLMDLASDHVKLTYRDWMGYRRCVANIARDAQGRLRVDSVEEFSEERT
ncbi:metallophosphoesterase family protein [Pyxidicoccus sp. 3LG]